MLKELVLATRNKGKIREFRILLADLPLELVTLDDVGFKDVIRESGESFAENAGQKAKKVGEKTGSLTLAEDAGLEIDALNGRPGIFSARYKEGTDEDRINKVLKELQGIPPAKRTARFRAVIALYNPINKTVKTFEGVSEGFITEEPRGKSGFGYDPIFYNVDLRKTNAEATLTEKNSVSHRARALEKAKRFLMIHIHAIA